MQMRKKIMVVDDSRMIYLQMKNLLEGTEYEIVSYCKDGEDAIVHYQQVAPDIVTMDIIMPGMDGLETAQAILILDPKAKIVMMSSLAYDETYEEAYSIGAKGFIDKPFDKERVLSVFEQVLNEADAQTEK